MGALFERKVILFNLGLLLFLILFFSELKQALPFAYKSITSTIVWVITIILFIHVNWKHQRTKRFGSQLKYFFQNQGYEIMEERPLSFVESIRYGIKLSTGDIGGIPLETFIYYGTNQRVFKAKRIESGNEWELYCEITTNWNKKINLTILKETRLTW